MKHFILFFLSISTMAVHAQIRVTEVYVENKNSPVGIVTEHPRFTWILESDRRETRQSAYEIRVAISEGDLKKSNKLLWSSGRVNSEQSVHVPFGGNGLLSGKVYFWQVRVWDSHNRTAKWSEVAQWQMGLLDPEREFRAKWIAPGFDEDTINRPSPYFRKEFSLASDSPVKKATAYITAHGMYEAELNGQRVGDAYFSPG